MSSDELGDLSADINGMLVALEVSQSKLANDNLMMQNILERTAIEEEKSRCILNSITDFVVTVECSSVRNHLFNDSIMFFYIQFF